MSVKIVKVYKQYVPALRFIGKKYGDSDRDVNGMFSKQVGEWLKNGWFDFIRKQTDENLSTLFEDGSADIGLMRWHDAEPFEFWLGIFMPEGTIVPDGFIFHDFPKSTLGVCWLQGKEPEIYGQEEKCAKKLMEAGHTIAIDDEKASWFFERWVSSRADIPDENGKIILDICHYIE